MTGIRIKNFARFRGEHEVSPLGPKAYAIVARDAEDEARSNYLGKTSLTVALRFGLYGVLPKAYEKLDDAISHGEDEMYVDVELSDGSYISRERKRGGSSTKLKLVGSDPLIGECECNQDEAQREIIKLIGLDLDNYDMCADVAQKTSDRFSTMKSTELTEVVSGWVGLERLVEAEDLAAKGLGALTKELAVFDAQIASLAWATETEGKTRAATLKKAQEEHVEQARFAEVRNAVVASHETWVRHAARAVQSDTLSSAIAELEAELKAAPLPTEVALQKAEQGSTAAKATLNTVRLEQQRLSQVARGAFDGVCPVLPGFSCPAKLTINASKTAAEQAVLANTQALEMENRAVAVAEVKLLELKFQSERRVSLRARISSMQSRLGDFEESVDYIAKHGQPPEVAPEPIVVDTAPSTLAQRAHQEWLTARPALVAYEESRPKLAQRIAVLRVAVLALEQAQRRLCEGVVQRIEQGANRRLEQAGVDLRCEWHWGRTTQKLATRCQACGAEFPASARVKQCQACSAPRGNRIEPKLHVKFSARSGGTEDLGGVAITLSAGEWVRRRRGSEWGVCVLDEPFASLDLAHRRALSGHLQKMVSDGIEQAFVIAHSRDVLESLPGRIEVVGRGEWSEVRVVA